MPMLSIRARTSHHILHYMICIVDWWISKRWILMARHTFLYSWMLSFAHSMTFIDLLYFMATDDDLDATYLFFLHVSPWGCLQHVTQQYSIAYGILIHVRSTLTIYLVVCVVQTIVSTVNIEYAVSLIYWRYRNTKISFSLLRISWPS